MLKMSLTLVTGLVRDRLGRASSLAQCLDTNAEKLQVSSLDASPGSIAADSVPRWHEWGQGSRSDGAVFRAGELLGWKTHRNFGYRSYRIVHPDLARLGDCTQLPGWHCDIQDVDGLHASKLTLLRFNSLDAMAQQEAAKLIDEVSSARLARLLERHEIRALCRRRSGDHFVRYLWDGRTFLINRSGSVHFAAARFMAARLEQRVALGGELHVHSIEPQAVSSLRRDFELFAVSARDAFASIAFHEALRRSHTPYLSKRMPRPHAHTEVIFLPRDDRRSVAVAAELRVAGFPDAGKHLSTLVLRQHMNAVRHGDGQDAMAA
ncbi:DUF6685 family protein [Azohydromonas australica]|uniref:DUF6685 family protein n=1 Tax=Azohydromonas australica TaxID=364039 RepID=UPI00040AAA60|nr:DUF6685 family protein [Azohydromonas australica]